MGSDGYRGLLVDYGGVLTTSLFDSFRSFCDLEGLEPESVGRRFREDPEARELLIGLETGALPEEEFEPRFAAILGVKAPGLIDRLFAGSGPEAAMVDAVLAAPPARLRPGPVSNPWG